MTLMEALLRFRSRSLPQPPAPGEGGLSLGGAAAVQTLILPGAEGTQQLRGVFVARLHPGQLQDPGVPGLRGAQGPAPSGPAQCGRGGAVNDADQAQRFPFQDRKR